MPKSQHGSTNSSGHMDVDSDSDDTSEFNYQTVDIVGIGVQDFPSPFAIKPERTYEDLNVKINQLMPKGSLVALVPIFGPYPAFRYPHDGEHVSPLVQRVNFVERKDDTSLVVVRTRDDDVIVPISLSEKDDESSMMDIVKDKLLTYEYSPISIRNYLGMSDIGDQSVKTSKLLSKAVHPTIAFVEIESGLFELRSQFKGNLPVPKPLNFLFARGEILVKRASHTEKDSLKVIHLARALLHLIVSAQEIVADQWDSRALDHYGKLHRLADGLERHIIETRNYSEQDLENKFYELCGDYIGAVAVRRSYTAFSSLRSTHPVRHSLSTTRTATTRTQVQGGLRRNPKRAATQKLTETKRKRFRPEETSLLGGKSMFVWKEDHLTTSDEPSTDDESAWGSPGPQYGEKKDQKLRFLSLGTSHPEEKAPFTRTAKVSSDVWNFADLTLLAAKTEDKEKEKIKYKDSETVLYPEAPNVVDDEGAAKLRSASVSGQRAKAIPYSSASSAPSRLPSNDWHPTEEPPPTEADRREFERALEGLDKDHQSIVVHYGGNTFWTRRLVLQKISEYYNATGNWPMRVERTGNRANARVDHAECAICSRGRDTQKLKVQQIAKHLTSEEWKLKPWRCMLCPAVYSYKDESLKSHVRNVHANDESNPQGDRSWRNSNEYVNISPAYAGSTGHLSPKLATLFPSFHQLSNSLPPFDIMRSPPTDIPHGGQPVASTYTTSLFPHSSRLEDPIMWSTQPPLLGAAPTVGDPFLPNTEIMFDTTLVPRPYVEPPSLPHRFDIQQASINAGTSIAPSFSGDSVSLSALIPLNRSGSFSSGSRAQYQQPIQGAIDPIHIPIPSVVNPPYKVPPSTGYVPGNARTNQPRPGFWSYTSQVLQAPGSSNMRSNQPISRSTPAPTEPRLQGQQRPQMINTQPTPSIRTSQSTVRTSNADLIGHSHPSIPKGGPISGPAPKAAIQAPRSIKPSTNKYTN
ncbi:hypothetical protein FRB91_010010 [Serendipita sp. 411]|nr:hypothetical protein FRB91_010010 [Serendipita sp. 411]